MRSTGVDPGALRSIMTNIYILLPYYNINTKTVDVVRSFCEILWGFDIHYMLYLYLMTTFIKNLSFTHIFWEGLSPMKSQD